MFQNHWEMIRKLQEVHQQDLMREAQQMRLYRLAAQGNPPANPLTWRLFGWLGLQLVNLGSQMQQHYALLARLSTDLESNLPCEESGSC
jgi:hypothetical protein